MLLLHLFVSVTPTQVSFSFSFAFITYLLFRLSHFCFALILLLLWFWPLRNGEKFFAWYHANSVLSPDRILKQILLYWFLLSDSAVATIIDSSMLSLLHIFFKDSKLIIFFLFFHTNFRCHIKFTISLLHITKLFLRYTNIRK